MKPLRIVVPFGAGGATDTFIRTLARDLQPALGQSVLVDNRPGGNFISAADAVIKAEPDGHTLMAATSGHAVTEALGTNQVRYRLLRDLVPVSTVNYIELILIAHPSLPVKSVRDLVRLARAKPGAINYATTGTGGINHLAMELLQSATASQMTHVPYKVRGAGRLEGRRTCALVKCARSGQAGACQHARGVSRDDRGRDREVGAADP